MNLIKDLTARIEAYRAENKNPCKNYATEEAAERATLAMAKVCAAHFDRDQRGVDAVRPAQYVVFYNEAWGRWVGCICISEVLHRPTSTGGYLGICKGFFYILNKEPGHRARSGQLHRRNEMRTVDSRVCTVCGQPATAPDVKYMEPRCLEHAHTLRPPSTGRRAFWDLPPLRPDVQVRQPGMSPAFQADYGALELRVLVSLMNKLAEDIALEMSKTTPMDLATARSMVQATVRTFASHGPLMAQELRQQKHIGYMVCADGRYMYWPVEGLQEARTYCEDNVEPVKLLADVAELNKHEEGQL